ncbi:hypothetical protein ACIO6U_03690 [Streptomyces sp. NPDC087422]|uniref:hypothetical protein n=1 Tax=Streptomyces sp. NPDC087422 TaxID=3365786 RepID=UPI003808E582
MATNSIAPLYVDQLTYAAAQDRRGHLMHTMAAGGALTGRSGVRPGDTGLTVTLAGSTISVSAGLAAIYQSTRGVYLAGMPSATATAASLTAAHATLARIDLVYLRVYDDAVDSSGLYGGEPVYLAGTPGAGVAPTPPAPQIWMPLATITVPPVGGGAASVSTTVRPYTVAPGGILPAVTAPASPYVGQAWHDGTDLKVWSGTSWDTYQKVLSVPYIDLTPGSGFTSPQGTLQKAQYRLRTVDGVQRVELRGSMKCTTDVTTQATFATIPVGFRPSVLRTVPVTRGFNSTSSGISRIEIDTAGVMSVFGAASPAQTSWFCMDGQSYDL